jgi:hypothetical protein
MYKTASAKLYYHFKKKNIVSLLEISTAYLYKTNEHVFLLRLLLFFLNLSFRKISKYILSYEKKHSAFDLNAGCRQVNNLLPVRWLHCLNFATFAIFARTFSRCVFFNTRKKRQTLPSTDFFTT